METLHVQNGVVSAVVYPRTPRRDLYFEVLVRRCAAWYVDVGNDLGITTDDINRYLTSWLLMLSRSEFTGLADEIPTLTDTPDEVRAKFLRFLDSEHAVFFEKVEEAMRRQDAPADVTIAPAPLETSAKKKT